MALLWCVSLFSYQHRRNYELSPYLKTALNYLTRHRYMKMHLPLTAILKTLCLMWLSHLLWQHCASIFLNANSFMAVKAFTISGISSSLPSHLVDGRAFIVRFLICVVRKSQHCTKEPNRVWSHCNSPKSGSHKWLGCVIDCKVKCMTTLLSFSTPLSAPCFPSVFLPLSYIWLQHLETCKHSIFTWGQALHNSQHH